MHWNSHLTDDGGLNADKSELLTRQVSEKPMTVNDETLL